VSIPDSLGLASPEEFSNLIKMIFDRVPNIEQAVISVHCHDDLGRAVDNSISALNSGARQIECSVNGLGARKGNAELQRVVSEVLSQGIYQIDIDTSLLSKASELVSKITGIDKEKVISQ
jgi:2-isopropylmalate synthase